MDSHRGERNLFHQDLITAHLSIREGEQLKKNKNKCIFIYPSQVKNSTHFVPNYV